MQITATLRKCHFPVSCPSPCTCCSSLFRSLAAPSLVRKNGCHSFSLVISNLTTSGVCNCSGLYSLSHPSLSFKVRNTSLQSGQRKCSRPFKACYWKASSPLSSPSMALLMCYRSLCTLRAAGGTSPPWSWMHYRPRPKVILSHPPPRRLSRVTAAYLLPALQLYLTAHSPSQCLKPKRGWKIHQLPLDKPQPQSRHPGHPNRRKTLLQCQSTVG